MVAWVLQVGAVGLVLLSFWVYEDRGVGAAGAIWLLVALLVWQAMRLRNIARKLEPTDGSDGPA